MSIVSTTKSLKGAKLLNWSPVLVKFCDILNEVSLFPFVWHYYTAVPYLPFFWCRTTKQIWLYLKILGFHCGKLECTALWLILFQFFQWHLKSFIMLNKCKSWWKIFAPVLGHCLNPEFRHGFGLYELGE